MSGLIPASPRRSGYLGVVITTGGVPVLSGQEGGQPSIRRDVTDNLARTFANLAAPGASWTGEERLAIATEARRARSGGPAADGVPAEAVEAARTLADRPAAARRTWVERLVAGGLGYPRYVELVGIVSRVVAADTFVAALGRAVEPLPPAVPGEPTGDIADGARPGKGWVPMVGGTSITQALSLIPAENAELERFHGPMYLTFEEMSQPTIARGLTRPQMEVLAARTSAFNECFY